MARERDLYDDSIQDDAVRLVVKSVEDCERRYHDAWIEKVERRYKAYRAMQQQTPSEEDWHSQVTTPYVLHTTEGMLATMLEPKPKFQVKPRPLPDEGMDSIEERMKVSRVLEETLSYALERDGFAMKQRDFMQQDLIAGLTVMKDYWMTERRKVTRLAEQSYSIEDAAGNEIDTLTGYEEEDVDDVLVRDDACSEVRDVRDFFWPSQAPNVEKAEYLIDRTWWSYAALKRQEDEGYFKDVSKLKDLRGSGQGEAKTQAVIEREQKLRGTDRTQDLYEVLEYWTPERVITVANRTVLLADKPNPFWNGRLPFVVCSSMPDAFQIPGISVVEALAQLQEMLWTLQNQRLDALRLLTNVITLIRSDVDDPDAFEWAPNAQWLVEDPSQVQTLPIDPTAASITLEAETLLKGDIQNILGGLPYGSGSDSGGGIDQETATGISIITSIAQRLIQARKQHYLWAYARLGKHFLQLYQQFLRDDRIVKVVGEGASRIWTEVTPLDLQGDFDVTIDVTSDSLLRQERRAEAQSLMQLMAGVAQVAAVSGTPINMRAPLEAVLDAFDIGDKENWFQATPPPGQGQPGAPPGMTPVPANGGAPPQGVTNAQAAAGPMSPSNENSMSPEASMSRLMAQRGFPAGG